MNHVRNKIRPNIRTVFDKQFRVGTQCKSAYLLWVGSYNNTHLQYTFAEDGFMYIFVLFPNLESAN